jgi:hypothetical protein
VEVGVDVVDEAVGTVEVGTDEPAVASNPDPPTHPATTTDNTANNSVAPLIACQDIPPSYVSTCMKAEGSSVPTRISTFVPDKLEITTTRYPSGAVTHPADPCNQP